MLGGVLMRAFAAHWTSYELFVHVRVLLGRGEEIFDSVVEAGLLREPEINAERVQRTWAVYKEAAGGGVVGRPYCAPESRRFGITLRFESESRLRCC
jgi:hypothetical protein